MAFGVREFLFRHGCTGRGIVATSGGADSVALLRAMVEAQVPVVAGHVHHGLRGEAADADEGFVERLAGQLNVPFVSRRIVVPNVGNWEASARTLRYDALTEMALQHSCNWIATAHTADDQAETLLHNMLRGTGLHGLRGIAAVRKTGSLSPAAGERVRESANDNHISIRPLLVRPLIRVEKQQILEYLKSLQQPFRTDATNFDTRYTRARLRNELLPQLKLSYPSIVAELCALAVAATKAITVFDRLAELLLTRAEKPQAGETVILDSAILLAAEPMIVRDLFRMLWRREGWPANAMTARHWHRLATLTPGDYPGRVRLSLRGRAVRLCRISHDG
jgi:tRNA(Ile)-lysidine synthase